MGKVSGPGGPRAPNPLCVVLCPWEGPTMTNLVKVPDMEVDLEAAFLGKLVRDKSEWLSGINAGELNAKLKVRSSAQAPG